MALLAKAMVKIILQIISALKQPIVHLKLTQYCMLIVSQQSWKKHKVKIFLSTYLKIYSILTVKNNKEQRINAN